MPDLGEFRPWLRILARSRISFNLRCRIDPSDVVQETLCAAVEWQQKAGVRSRVETMLWLRRKLRDKLVDRLRRLNLQPINMSLLDDDSLDNSSHRIGDILRDSRSGPPAKIIREEDTLLVAEVLGKLSSAQAEAIVLKHCEGWSVNEISRHMNNTPAAVGGLLRHGMRHLRELMPQED
jgi:RNA polymerase sigma-70 factor, ECF subfamily